MDCDRIAPNLFVGSCLLDRKEARELRALGVTAVLSLQTEVGGEGGVGRKACLPKCACQYFDAADLQRKLPECLIALDGMLKAGHTVYLHCTAGTGRSPTVAASVT